MLSTTCSARSEHAARLLATELASSREETKRQYTDDHEEFVPSGPVLRQAIIPHTSVASVFLKPSKPF